MDDRAKAREQAGACSCRREEQVWWGAEAKCFCGQLESLLPELYIAYFLVIGSFSFCGRCQF